MTEHSLADEIERLVKRLASPDTTTDITQAAADIGWLVTSWASTILLALRAPRPAEPEAAEAERVARAIYEYQPPNIPRPSIPTWGEATTERQELFRGFARAALAALLPADPGPGVIRWRSMDEFPAGEVTEDAGCRGSSEWVLGRRKDGDIRQVRRRAWPHDDGFADRDENYYQPGWFTGWTELPLAALPQPASGDARAGVERAATRIADATLCQWAPPGDCGRDGEKCLCEAAARAALAQGQADKQSGEDDMTELRKINLTDDQVRFMVDRFLMWRLPENFSPDNGISFEPIMNAGTPYEMQRTPVGTNLLDYTQAEKMVRHMLNLDPKAALAQGQTGSTATHTTGD